MHVHAYGAYMYNRVSDNRMNMQRLPLRSPLLVRAKAARSGALARATKAPSPIGFGGPLLAPSRCTAMAEWSWLTEGELAEAVRAQAARHRGLCVLDLTLENVADFE